MKSPPLLYVIPVLSLFVAALSLFISIETGPMRSVQLLGGPTDSADGFFGRLHAVEEAGGLIRPLSDADLELRAIQGQHESVRQLTTGPEGWTEFELPRLVDKPLTLEVRDSRGKVLAEGEASLSTPRWLGSGVRRGGELRQAKEGSLEASVRIPMGILAVPFRGEFSVRVVDGGRALAGARVSLKGVGAEVVGEKSSLTDEKGEAVFTLRPIHHVASAVVVVEGHDKKLTFEQVLPLVPGSFGLERRGQDLQIRSPVPRDAVWYTFVSESRRAWGGRISLKRDADGYFSGILASSEIPEMADAYLVVSAAADGRSNSSVGFPLSGQGVTLDMSDAYFLDGAPQIRHERSQRTRKVRLVLGSYIALSGLITLVLFYLRIRAADGKLRRSLNRVGAGQGTQNESPVALVFAVLSLFFAFSAAVLWIVAR